MRLSRITSLPMTHLLAQLALAAEPQSAAKQASGAEDWSLTSIVSGVITLGAVLALIWIARRIFLARAAGPKNSPRQLLHELCQAHGLSRRAERLLRKAAAALGTPHPGRFFLEPQLLRQAEECEQLQGNRRALNLLYERLFGKVDT
jgi:hypothetical protein